MEEVNEFVHPFGFYKQRQVKATRKEHTCFLCAHTIPKGKSAIYEFLVSPGRRTGTYRCPASSAGNCNYDPSYGKHE